MVEKEIDKILGFMQAEDTFFSSQWNDEQVSLIQNFLDSNPGLNFRLNFIAEELDIPLKIVQKIISSGAVKCERTLQKNKARTNPLTIGVRSSIEINKGLGDKNGFLEVNYGRPSKSDMKYGDVSFLNVPHRK